jgi:hypothetical protein
MQARGKAAQDSQSKTKSDAGGEEDVYHFTSLYFSDSFYINNLLLV